MLSKLNKLPNPQETAQSLKPLKRASSMRKDQGKKRVDHFDDYIDPEGTGDFKDHTFDKDVQEKTKKVDKIQKKREIKIAEKDKIKTNLQQTSSAGKKQVQFNIHKQDSNDSILKMSEQGTRTRNPTPSNESPSSSRKSRTRGPGKKTIER